jgi:hypothetical protein
MPTKSGLHRHHLLDVRFADMLGIDPNTVPGVYKTPTTHQIFTNQSRSAIPYGTGNVNIDKIWQAMQQVYADFSIYLEAVRLFLKNQGYPRP